MRDLVPCCICRCTRNKKLHSATVEVLAPAASLDPYSGHYQINQCTACGLIFSSPIMEEKEVKELYTNYRESNVTVGEINNVRRTMMGYYELMRPFFRDKGRFLDIGCDIGLLLDIAAQDGFANVQGLEPVGPSREIAKRRIPQADISSTFYQDHVLPIGSLDAIALIHVLDHLAHPEQHLKKAWHDLKPGGLVIAVVHNVESLLALTMGERFPVFNYFHHYFFSKRTLAALFKAHDFEPLRIASTWNTYSLAFFIERLPFFPSKPTLMAIARITRSLQFGKMPLSIPVGNIAVVARKKPT
jgi:2-polyprenyl-3-methyl-5-hydroxy-6-metoxy-1,4-benzoquinol methylase